MGRRYFLTLGIGILAGFIFACILLISIGFSREVVRETYRESSQDVATPLITSMSSHSSDEPAHKDEDRSVADELFKRVRVLCWVMTQPKSHETKAKHVKATWGKRCNKLLFMSTGEGSHCLYNFDSDKDLPAVKLNVSESWDYLWAKTKAAFRYVYEHHRREADWFLKADDDTYVIVENLRYMLADYNSNNSLWFGCRFNHYSPQGYMSGGAGYVLSRAALDKFVTQALRAPHLCNAGDFGAEDANMGECLHNVGVRAMDSRDELKRGRFFPFMPKDHLFPPSNKNFWYYRYIYYTTDEYRHQGLDCCSNHAVTFHYVDPHMMHVFDYFIYHLRPYGIRYGIGRLPKILSNGTGDLSPLISRPVGHLLFKARARQKG